MTSLAPRRSAPAPTGRTLPRRWITPGCSSSSPRRARGTSRRPGTPATTPRPCASVARGTGCAYPSPRSNPFGPRSGTASACIGSARSSAASRMRAPTSSSRCPTRTRRSSPNGSGSTGATRSSRLASTGIWASTWRSARRRVPRTQCLSTSGLTRSSTLGACTCCAPSGGAWISRAPWPPTRPWPLARSR